MSDERWTIVDRLFDAALDREPHERAAFLDEACADDAVRREVESLLAHASGAGDFLAAPALELVERARAERRDPSLVGRRLGPYRILSLLGIGGMGEVYRAHDSTLARDVAIKVLPRLVTTDLERRARFDREARLLASLNHPHIGAIYGVEDMDGTPALILELVEGDTVADRLQRGPMAIGEALHIARQIADALEAAHEKGIIHRDLKPANIKITPAGVVKVLDFGLAKAASGDASGADLAQSPTLTIGGTHEGVILGTAAYMSPEQARGRPIDKRTDLWAFGCVLYEMLASRSAFASDTISDTIARILERDPDWRALPAATPPSVTRLLQRCLDKDPKRRLHDIADARIEVEDALSASPAPAEIAVVDRRPVLLPWAIAVVTSVVVLIAALTWYLRTSRHAQTAPPRISRTTIAASGTAAVFPNLARSLAITPDGTRVVYVGNNGRQLFVRPLDRLDSVAIVTGTAPLNWVCVSSDGQWVAFDEGGALKRVALTGGPVVTILNTGLGNSNGATWAPDDTVVFATQDPATGLQRVSARGGDVAVLTRPDQARGELDHLWPEMLPGGRAVLFTITATGGPDAAQVAVFDLATGTARVVLQGGSHAHYVPSGHLVYAADGTLRAVPFDLGRLEARGTPVTVLPRLLKKAQGAADFVVAADGTLAYVDAPDFAAMTNTLVWVDRLGREQPLDAPPRAYSHPRVSPDGKRVAVVTADDIWMLDLARPGASQLTFAPAPNFAPVWTKDGDRLLFFSPLREAGLFWQAADGTGAAERLGAGVPSGVTADGKQVLFNSVPGSRDLMLLTLDVSHHVEPLIQTPSSERNGVVSSNGRWLAYESDSSGKFEIYVKPFPNVSAGQWLVSTAGGTRPLWAPNGEELFFVAPDGSLMAVRVEARGSSWRAGSPVRVVEGRYLIGGGRSSPNYDVSRDGTRFLMVKPPVNQAAAPQIIVVQNWLDELKARVPVR
jgi:serine/threonine protein kinase